MPPIKGKRKRDACQSSFEVFIFTASQSQGLSLDIDRDTQNIVPPNLRMAQMKVNVAALEPPDEGRLSVGFHQWH
jgi:hypothetical protein